LERKKVSMREILRSFPLSQSYEQNKADKNDGGRLFCAIATE
jgi:hypothetical protein